MKRLAFIDALKAVASQLIVLHHLAFYGPMSDYAKSLAPATISWLYDYARLAVQVFLVVGGFLAAQSLVRHGLFAEKPLVTLLWRRYLKLVLPCLAALTLAILSAAFARSLMNHPATPAAPTLTQLLAHVFLLQDLLDFDGLSAGLWYVAIDFQLYALLILLLWLARHFSPSSTAAPRLLALALVAASLFGFNRNPALDSWATYFFGAYGLGVLTFALSRQEKNALPLLMLFLLVLTALLIDYRIRIAVALMVAVLLAIASHTGWLERWPESALIAWLGKISYAVFLVHYPVCLAINALFEHFLPHAPAIQLGGMMLAWAASLACGALFYRQVECRAQTLLFREIGGRR